MFSDQTSRHRFSISFLCQDTKVLKKVFHFAAIIKPLIWESLLNTTPGYANYDLMLRLGVRHAETENNISNGTRLIWTHEYCETRTLCNFSKRLSKASLPRRQQINYRILETYFSWEVRYVWNFHVGSQQLLINAKLSAKNVMEIWVGVKLLQIFKLSGAFSMKEKKYYSAPLKLRLSRWLKRAFFIILSSSTFLIVRVFSYFAPWKLHVIKTLR